MTEAIKFYAISLAIVVLLNLIFLIVKERVREIATLKVLNNKHQIIIALKKAQVKRILTKKETEFRLC